MVSDDFNDVLIKLQDKRACLVELVASLNSAKKYQGDMCNEFDRLTTKVKTKIAKTDDQIKELCDFIVEAAKTEADAYDAMYRTEEQPDCETDSYLFM